MCMHALPDAYVPCNTVHESKDMGGHMIIIYRYLYILAIGSILILIYYVIVIIDVLFFLIYAYN